MMIGGWGLGLRVLASLGAAYGIIDVTFYVFQCTKYIDCYN